jgi:Protein of unknown function (DUF1573)
MQVRKFHILTVLLLISFSGLANQQKPVIFFAEKEFNFGTIKEIDGIVQHDFQFTNRGKVPLIVNDVRSTCGCTVPAWTREPVLPGKSGIITVRFDPKQLEGSVTKTIQIISNADVPQVVLSINGIVIPSEKIEEVFKFSIGDIRLQTIYAAFGEIYKGKTAIFSIRVFNKSQTLPAAISFKNLPVYLKVTVQPELIPPQQEGLLIMEYLTMETSSWDYSINRLDLLINGKEVPNNRVNVTANIKEDFSGLSAEQLASAARVEFDTQQFDFGTIPENIIVNHSFKLTNSGKSDLYIRKVSASCGCTAVQPLKTKIMPGDSTEIKAVFNPKGREGNQKKAITVVTNDPKKSKTVLWISAVIEKSVNINQ